MDEEPYACNQNQHTNRQEYCKSPHEIWIVKKERIKHQTNYDLQNLLILPIVSHKFFSKIVANFKRAGSGASLNFLGSNCDFRQPFSC